MRQKRLQRLQQLQSTSNSDVKSGSGLPSSTSTSLPSSAAQSPKEVKSPQSEPTPTPVQKPTTVQKEKPAPISFEQWQHNTIQDIFSVAIDRSSQKDTQIITLDSLREELEEEMAAPILLSTDLLDRVLWSTFTQHKSLSSPFDYLWTCWSRAGDLKRLLNKNRGSPDYEAKLEVLDNIQTICKSYTVLVTTTDMIESDLKSPQINVGARLISKISASLTAPWDFVHACIDQAEKDGMLNEFLTQIIQYLHGNLAKVMYTGDYKPYLSALEGLMTSRVMANQITVMQGFHVPSNCEAPNIVTSTILGPFLGISPLDGDGPIRNFPNSDILSPMDIRRMSQDIQSEHKVIQNRLFEICNRIVRASADARQALLKYFGDVINKNHKRLAMRVDPKLISPDGFLINITYVLTKLSEPFTDLYGSKIDKINFNYFQQDAVLNISEETKILSDINESQEYNFRKDGEVANFISHVFFLTSAYHHYGLGGTIQSQGRIKRALDELKNHVERLEAEQGRWRGTTQEPLLNLTLERIRKQLSQAKAVKLSLDCILYDIHLSQDFLNFVLFEMTFLVRAVEPTHSYPQTNSAQIKLPLDNNVPEYFKNYPEYLVESGVSYVLFIGRHIPQVILDSLHQRLLIFLVVFLRNTSYIKNPYLKSKLVEVLYAGSLDIPLMNGGFKPGMFVSLFDTEKLCLDHLFHALMNFYIEVEQTGTSSQFYDKFNTRYYISEIIKCIWKNNVYRQRLAKESEDDVHFFVQFVALLLNDATYLLDESLRNLSEIHRLQSVLAGQHDAHAGPSSFNDPDDDDEDEDDEGDGMEENDTSGEQGSSQDNRSRLSSAERQAKSYMQLTNQTVKLLGLFTSAVPKALVTSEIVDRLAAMVNYNLVLLVGPKCRELKVQNPESYGFNPRELLSLLCDIYLNLSDQPAFVKGVARDGRSYDAKNFERAKEILSRWGLKPAKQLETLTEFAKATEQVRLEDEQGELELGDIPDEFLDPVMYTLMEEPVILPSSRVTIDLGTIKSHLLSDPKDPFNRAPLKIEDVIPDTELKQKIEAFKKAKREEYARNKMDVS